MDNYKELKDRLRSLAGGGNATLVQGIVTRVDGILCDLKVGGIIVPDVRLRASETEDGGHILITPKVGSAVIVGSLSGDLSQLAVLSVDHAESVVFNGGKLGGLIKIAELTDKINELVQAFNSHTHQGVHGPTGAPLKQASTFSRSDYEDTTVTH